MVVTTLHARHLDGRLHEPARMLDGEYAAGK